MYYLSLSARPLIILICILLQSCSSSYSHHYISQPSNIHNICSIFGERPLWYFHASNSARKWRVPIPVMMSIMHHESSFKATARPLRYSKWSIELMSSAYGYPQAIDSTWQDYKRSVNKSFARRDIFSDAIDFIGWYIHRSYLVAGISKYNSKHNYFAYHEGHTGYKKGRYRQKQWLLNKSNEVANLTKKYDKQLSSCDNDRVLISSQ